MNGLVFTSFTSRGDFLKSWRIFIAAYHTLFYISEGYALKGGLIMSTFQQKNDYNRSRVIRAYNILIELLRFFPHLQNNTT